jgi:hypothetical protein
MTIASQQGTPKSNVTFGKFNKTLPKSTLEIVDTVSGFKKYMVKSKGFSFADQSYDFPAGKSFMSLEPFDESNGYITQNPERFNSSKVNFANIWKRLTNDDAHKFTWIDVVDVDVSASTPVFPSTSCKTINDTMYAYLEKTKGPKGIKWPIYEVNVNEYNLTFNYEYFLQDLGLAGCFINIPFILVNASGPFASKVADDVIVIGNSFFNSFSGMQFDFDAKKVAYQAYPSADNNNHILPAKASFPIWILIVGAFVIAGVVGYICYREKKLKKDLEQAANQYGAL